MKKYLTILSIIFVIFLYYFASDSLLSSKINSCNMIYSQYSSLNNLSFKNAKNEMDGILKISILQSGNNEGIEEFVILNLLNIGYIDKTKIINNTNLILEFNQRELKFYNLMKIIFVVSLLLILFTIIFSFLLKSTKKQP